MMSLASRKSRAFSLIELVIVVVIIGIIAAIAIPRMSRGAAGAGDSALSSNLAMLRKALEMYAAEHDNVFPPIGKMPGALEQYTSGDADPTVAATRSATTPFGPYLRKVPKLNVGPAAGHIATIVTTADGSGGWLYDPATGDIKANLAGTILDANGKAYNTY
jgi:prepilin-type N-terminal cleavage/methylation domain-containing protein